MSAISARLRLSWFLTTCALAILPGLLEPVAAQTFGTGGNDYPGGINVSTNQTPINVTLDPGVVVTIPPNTINNAVSLSSTTAAGTGGPITLIANNAAITINTGGITTQETSAIRLQAAGDAIIGTTANPVLGIINVTGTNSTNAIWAKVFFERARRISERSL